MRDEEKTKQLLIRELVELRGQLAGLEASQAERRQPAEWVRKQGQMTALGRLAEGIAHDLNSTLMAITLYAELLLGEPSLPQDLAPDVEGILEEAQSSLRLVGQIQDFSARSPIDLRLVDLRTLAQEAAAALQPTLPANICLRLEVGPDEYLVEAGVASMYRALMNLVMNARDAMPEGGDLHIGLSRTASGPGEEPPVEGISPVSMPVGEWVCLSVSDTGSGIQSEVMDLLFEPFFTTKPEGTATGLGLAQVYGIVTQHGGHIDVKTEVGEWTTFRVYLPAQKPPPAEEFLRIEEISSDLMGKGEAILVAEDEERVRALCRRVLELLGYQVLVAANGLEALEICQSGEKIDLLLTDIVMPEMGGQELIRELRRMSFHLKIVVMTGGGVSEELRHLEEQGSVEVVHKPLDKNSLAQVVRYALDEGLPPLPDESSAGGGSRHQDEAGDISVAGELV